MARPGLELLPPPNNEVAVEELEGPIGEEMEDVWEDDVEVVDWRTLEIHSNYRLCRKCNYFWGQSQTLYSWVLAWEYMNNESIVKKNQSLI